MICNQNCIHYNVCGRYTYQSTGMPCNDFLDKNKITSVPCEIGDIVYEINTRPDCAHCVSCGPFDDCLMKHEIVEHKVHYFPAFFTITDNGQIKLKSNCYLFKSDAENALAATKQKEK